MIRIGYARSQYDSCIYLKKKNGQVQVYLLIYVDDILIASSSKNEIKYLKAQLSSEFEMKHLGEARRILGMNITRDRENKILLLNQEAYLKKVLLRFNMKAKKVSTPLGQQMKLSSTQTPDSEMDKRKMEFIPYASGVGSLMYGMVCTRPDLAYAISVISRFMANPGMYHWEALKWVLRYLRSTLGLGLKYQRQNEASNPIVGFVDSDYAGNLDSRKSLTCYIFTLYGTAITWKSNLQSVVALSTTEAEYIASTEAIKEGMRLKRMMEELGIKQEVLVVYCDNQSDIHLSKHQVFHERSKHIDVKLHFVRDVLTHGEIMLENISTENNPADALTKVLPQTKFKHCLNLVGMVEIN